MSIRHLAGTSWLGGKSGAATRQAVEPSSVRAKHRACSAEGAALEGAEEEGVQQAVGVFGKAEKGRHQPRDE